MEVRAARCRKVHFSTSRLILFRSKLSRNRPPTPPPPALRFHSGSCGHFDRRLNETGSEKGKNNKKDGRSGSHAACMPFARRDISSLGIFSFFFLFPKGWCCTSKSGRYSRSTADRVTSSPVGGVGQIRPHNCLRSQAGTAASLRPLKPATDCCSFG